MKRGVIGLALALIAAPQLAEAQSCQSAEETFTAGGLLSRRTFQDAAGRPEVTFILDLPQAECLRGKDEEDNVKPTRRLHVFATDAKVQRQLSRLVGKRVMLEGRAFGAITAHHHAPIVVDVTSVDVP